MNTVLSLLFVLLAFTSCWTKEEPQSSHGSEIVDIDFDQGLGKQDSSFSLILKSPKDQKRHRIAKKVWEENRPARVKAQEKPKIPKIIHQIWLGPKRPPRFYFTFRETWEKMHPDWEYRFWTDEDVQNFDFELKDLFNQSTNYGEKADILRCEILLAFGGLYVDTDFECLKSFNELITKYDFFAGIEPPHAIPESEHVLLTSNALIGACPNHPVLLKWKEFIRNRWDKAEEECFSPVEKVLVRTFLPFAEAVDLHLDTPGYTNIVFPSTYFYPIKPVYLRHPPKKPNFFKKLLIAFDVKSGHPFSEIKKETMAVHYFASEWQKSSNELIRDIHHELVKLKKGQKELEQELASLKLAGLKEKESHGN